MRERVAVRVLAVVLLAAGADVEARAANEAQEAARRHNKTGQEAFKAEKYEEALEAFQRAFDLLPDAKLRVNLGVTNEKLRRLDEARLHYEAFLREDPRSEKRGAIEGKIAEVDRLMKQWGKVVITPSPGADRAELGVHVFTNFPAKIWLEPGTYRLVVTRAGYEKSEQDVVVKAGVRGEVTVALRPAPQGSTPATGSTTTDKSEASATASAGVGQQDSAAGGAGRGATGTGAGESTGGGGGISVIPWALRGVGGVGIALSVVTLLIGALGAGTSGGVYGVRLTVNGTDAYTRLMEGAFVGGFVLLGACVLLAPLVALLAGGVLVASFFVG